MNSVGVSEASNLLMWNVGSDSVLPTLPQMPSPAIKHSVSFASAALCNKSPPPHVLNNAGTSSSPAAPFLLVVAQSASPLLT